MKPLNLDNRPCSPISSNCVIWQGPDIPCIKLCTGDTVSDMVAKLGTELCTIMDQLNVSNYDLSCLDLTGCAPADFKGLIQLLITRICELNGITPATEKASGCPDCVVSVAPCFVQGTQTTMQLIDYVQMIANRVCSILDEIANINNQITTINTTLADLQYQIDNLPTYTLPSIPVDCILGPGNHSLDVVLETLMNDDTLGYCRLLQATGTPAEVNAAVLSQCIADSDHALASGNPGTTFSAYYAGSWINSGTLGSAPTVANAINNAWIAICDIYTYLASGFNVADTTTVNLSYSGGILSAVVQDTGWIELVGFRYYNDAYTGTAAFRAQCRRIGNVVYFRGYLVVPLATNADVRTALTYNYQSTGTPADSYFDVAHPYTANTGPGSCQVNSSGFINFNQGLSVIPSGILMPGQTLDNTYGYGYRIAYRPIKLGTAGYSTMLTSLASVAVLPNGILQWGVTSNSEESIIPPGSNLAFNTSPVNYIQSIVRAGDYVPQFAAATSVYDGSPSTGNQNTVLNYPTPSSAQYPFNANSTLAEEIGGMGVRLDGLTAFINPCDPVITTPTPC